MIFCHVCIIQIIRCLRYFKTWQPRVSISSLKYQILWKVDFKYCDPSERKIKGQRIPPMQTLGNRFIGLGGPSFFIFFLFLILDGEGKMKEFHQAKIRWFPQTLFLELFSGIWNLPCMKLQTRFIAHIHTECHLCTKPEAEVRYINNLLVLHVLSEHWLNRSQSWAVDYGVV